jgi:hypothetical protein
MIVQEAEVNLKHSVKRNREKFHSAQQSLKEITIRCVNKFRDSLEVRQCMKFPSKGAGILYYITSECNKI